MHLVIKRVVQVLLVVMMPHLSYAGQAVDEGVNGQALYARVGGEQITQVDFQALVSFEARMRFYHAKPPEEQYEVFEKEIGAKLIELILVEQVARAAGLAPDMEYVAGQVSTAQKSGRLEQMADVSGVMQSYYERESLSQQLRESTAQKRISNPTEKDLTTFYQKNIELFTEPRQYHLSLLLLKVPPWEGTAAWQARLKELEAIRVRIVDGGESFGRLVLEFSNDITADEQGDMGYQHVGMLSAAVEQHIKDLSVGDVSAPLRLLDGHAIFLVNGIRQSKVRTLAEARARVVNLLAREVEEGSWQEFVQGLRKGSAVKLY